jgi:hypothetical protein
MKFSIVVNIDQPRIGVWGKTSSIAAPNRQLSATERSVMLPPNTGEHHVIYPTKSTIQPRRDRNSSMFQVWQADAFGLHRACSTRSRSPHLRVPGMQDDWEFCSRDLAATSQLLRPVGSGSGFVFADRSISYPPPNALRPLGSHIHFHEGARLLRAGLPRSSCPHRAALLLRTSAA